MLITPQHPIRPLTRTIYRSTSHTRNPPQDVTVMVSDSTIRPYTSKLAPNDPKRKMLNDTFNWLDHAYKVFFDISVALFGGIDYEAAEELIDEKSTFDADLLCAIMWFRLEEKSNNPGPLQTTEQRTRLFQKYSGHEPSSFAQEYIKGNTDTEKYEWVDCRLKFADLARNIHTTQESLKIDAYTLFMNKLIPVSKDDEFNAYGFISQLFGTGKKEDRSVKASMLEEISNIIEDKKPNTWAEYQDLIKKTFNVSNYKELKEKLSAGSSGRDGSLVIDLKEEKTGLLQPNFIKNRIVKFREDADKKRTVFSLPNRMKLREFIASQIGPFEQNSWSAVLNRSMAAIQSKNSSNILYTNQKQERNNEIQELLKEDILSAASILNDFRRGEFNSSVVSKNHLGSRLNELFEMWQALKMNDGIEKYIDLCKDNFSRRPVSALLQYIYPYFDKITAKQFLDAASYNTLVETNNRKKIHPTVTGPTVCNWGPKSTINGSITPPNQMVKDRPAGSHGMIWVTMTVRDNGRWVKHHLPFHNSRYYEEHYCYREGLPTKNQPRTKQLGTQVGSIISAPSLAILKSQEEQDRRNDRKSRFKAHKSIIRSQENIKYNVAFDKSTNFDVTRKNGEFFITISSRVTTPKYSHKLNVGDIIMGLDNNQTAPCTYSIWRIVEKDTEGSFFHNKIWLQLVTDGKITSIVDNNRQVDQLSYAGVEYSNFAEWRKDRRQFLRSINEDYVKKSDNWLNMNLYQWNAEYSRLLLGVMKDNKDKNIQNTFRAEIEELICGKFGIRLGSLSHHSLQFLTNCKSLISSYFMLNNKKEEHDQESFDSDFFRLMKSIDDKRIRKRKEKSSRISSSVLQIARENNVKSLCVEGDLPTATKKTKPKQNQKSIDWCARAVVKKLNDGCKVLGINLQAIDPRDTSHLDPFVYYGKKSTKVGKEARYVIVEPSNIKEYMTKKFTDWHRGVSKKSKKGDVQTSTTAPLYQEALKQFADHYKLDFDSLPKMKFYELAKILEDHKQVIIPCRGGRAYLSTYPITKDSSKINFNGRERWYNQSDVVAAVNIVLRGIRDENEQLDDTKKQAPTRKT